MTRNCHQTVQQTPMPGLDVTEAMEITTHDGRFVIDTVEVIGRYVEILAHQAMPEGNA